MGLLMGVVRENGLGKFAPSAGVCTPIQVLTPFKRTSDILTLCQENNLDTITACGPSLKEIRLDQLTVRLHSPYWLLHQGNCQHLFIIEQIRYAIPVSFLCADI